MKNLIRWNPTQKYIDKLQQESPEFNAKPIIRLLYDIQKQNSQR